MKVCSRALLVLFAVISTTAFAQFAPGHRDAEAIRVLSSMDGYTESMERFAVHIESYADAVIGTSMVISNPSSSEILVDRSGSLRSSTNDGAHTSVIYIHDGELTLYSNKDNVYAKAEVPEELEEALMFALTEFEVETPLLDLLLLNSLDHFVSDIESVIYVTDKSPIRGVDCHHIVVSGPHIDLQIWVEEGANPVPRKTVMTLKADLGRPRHEVFMDWSAADPDSSDFEFKAPSGAIEIDFVKTN